METTEGVLVGSITIGIHVTLTSAADKEEAGVLLLYYLAERLTSFVIFLESLADCRPVEAGSKILKSFPYTLV